MDTHGMLVMQMHMLKPMLGEEAEVLIEKAQQQSSIASLLEEEIAIAIEAVEEAEATAIAFMSRRLNLDPATCPLVLHEMPGEYSGPIVKARVHRWELRDKWVEKTSVVSLIWDELQHMSSQPLAKPSDGLKTSYKGDTIEDMLRNVTNFVTRFSDADLNPEQHKNFEELETVANKLSQQAQVAVESTQQANQITFELEKKKREPKSEPSHFEELGRISDAAYQAKNKQTSAIFYLHQTYEQALQLMHNVSIHDEDALAELNAE